MPESWILAQCHAVFIVLQTFEMLRRALVRISILNSIR